MKRILDLIFCLVLIVILIIPFLIIGILIKVTSQGPIIHWSKRIGKNNVIFFMPKFRTMKINTPHVTTNKLMNPQQWITPFGRYLRKYSLDEIPQIYSILINDMSFVGPRPALYNEYKLIKIRTKYKIHKCLPGLTGLAQINGRDDLSLSEKVSFEITYLKNKSFILDIYILFKTFFYVIRSKNISH